MAVISRVKTWSTGETLTSTDLNAEFNNILNDYNGNITNANIDAAASIAYSKLSLVGSIVNADIDASAAIAYSKLNLTGSIVNADINASAAIDASKLSGVVTTTGTETISGVKTFSAATKSNISTASDGGTVTFNMNTANVHTVTIAGNRTLAVSNVATGQRFIVRIVQDGTGSRTVTWWNTIKWDGGTVPTLTTTGNKADVFGFLCTATDQYDGYVLGMNH